MTKRTDIGEFGKFLRKLRIDNDDEKLKDMAKRLNLSTGHLGEIELGKRKIPKYMRSSLIVIYKLSDIQINELDKILNRYEGVDKSD